MAGRPPPLFPGPTSIRRRPLALSLALVLATIALGLVIRFAPIGLPRIVTKYGGSMLWALTIYWLLTTLLASLRLPLAATLSAVIATAVEFLKLYHAPGLEAFRLTLPGILLLGRHFSAWDIAAYWIAICIGALADGIIRRTPSRP